MVFRKSQVAVKKKSVILGAAVKISRLREISRAQMT